MDGEAIAAVRDGNVVYLDRFGGRAGLAAGTAGRQRKVGPAEREATRHAARERLRALLTPGALVHAVLRFHDPECDWLVCDFYLIDGAEVTYLTQDVALAIEQDDPEREIGIRLHRPASGNALERAINDRLSRALFGKRGLLRHRAIG